MLCDKLVKEKANDGQSTSFGLIYNLINRRAPLLRTTGGAKVESIKIKQLVQILNKDQRFSRQKKQTKVRKESKIYRKGRRSFYLSVLCTSLDSILLFRKLNSYCYYYEISKSDFCKKAASFFCFTSISVVLQNDCKSFHFNIRDNRDAQWVQPVKGVYFIFKNNNI